MWSFLAEFFRGTDSPYKIVVMDEEGADRPRQYTIHPKRIVALWGGSIAVVALLITLLVVFTPVRQLIPGYGTEEIEQSAQVNAARVAALSDSLQMQQQYIGHLRALITGEPVDTTLADAGQQLDSEPSLPASGPGAGNEANVPSTQTGERASGDPPAAPSYSGLPAGPHSLLPLSTNPTLTPPQPPLLPPVDGFVTRNFEPDEDHYALDLAAEEGTPVHSIGDGYVILADRTEEGGYTVAIQHAGGYTSVYKHNNELLKDVGDRVDHRETIALSGNSGEITSGPHLHFELWRNGIALDPQQYFAEP